MSNYVLTGKIYKSLPKQVVKKKDGSTFEKLEVVFEVPITNSLNRVVGNSYITVEFSGDLIDSLKSLQKGDNVDVFFNLNGTKYADKRTGEERFFNSLRAWRIECSRNNVRQQAETQQQQAATTPPPPQEQPQTESFDDLPF